MSVKHRITDGGGSEVNALVVPEGALLVNQMTCPPLFPQKCIVFSQKFTVDGTASGSDDMGIDGSATAVEFYIPASMDNDRYITSLSFIMGYGGVAQLYEFADSGAALTNGVRVYYVDTVGDEVTIMNPKANYSFQRASLAPIGHNNWQDRGFAAASDYGYFINIDLTRFVPPYGVKLDKGTNQRMSILIRDDCTDADLFNCQSFGFERFE